MSLTTNEPGEVVALARRFRAVLADVEGLRPTLEVSFSAYGPAAEAAAVMARPAVQTAEEALLRLVQALEASPAYREQRRARRETT